MTLPPPLACPLCGTVIAATWCHACHIDVIPVQTSYVGAAKDIRAVQELLGHASVATTQVYTATEDDVMRQAVDFAA